MSLICSLLYMYVQYIWCNYQKMTFIWWCCLILVWRNSSSIQKIRYMHSYLCSIHSLCAIKFEGNFILYNHRIVICHVMKSRCMNLWRALIVHDFHPQKGNVEFKLSKWKAPSSERAKGGLQFQAHTQPSKSTSFFIFWISLFDKISISDFFIKRKKGW